MIQGASVLDMQDFNFDGTNNTVFVSLECLQEKRNRNWIKRKWNRNKQST